MIAFLRRAVRAGRLAATDERIPRPLRALAAVGLLPVPGPFDEALLLLVAVPLGVFYREPLADAWGLAADERRPARLPEQEDEGSERARRVRDDVRTTDV